MDNHICANQFLGLKLLLSLFHLFFLSYQVVVKFSGRQINIGFNFFDKLHFSIESTSFHQFLRPLLKI